MQSSIDASNTSLLSVSDSNVFSELCNATSLYNYQSSHFNVTNSHQYIPYN